MLMTEWNWDDALAVRYEEGWDKGWDKSRENRDREIILNALSKGHSPETIHEFTGIEIDVINKVASGE